MNNQLPNIKPHIIAIVGPTASGKSELAVQIAKKIGGEILSVDSRQIYKNMNIGSGKVAGKIKKGIYTYKSVPHYGIDIASPKQNYSAAKFQIYGKKIINLIFKHNKTPIICGGTGHWIDSLVFNQAFPKVKPNQKIRKELRVKSTAELFTLLKLKDPKRAKSIDARNPHRLIRALEIILTTGKPVPSVSKSSPYDIIWIGINPGMNALEEKIKKRLEQRIKHGMITEVKNLHNDGLSWKKLESFGLEYKFCALYLQGKLSKKVMADQLYTAIRQYAKRQMTWFKRNKDIHWVLNDKEALALTN